MVPLEAGCCLTTAHRALVAGSPRPKAETGRTAAAAKRRGAQIFF
ncbi:MAG TPA: hypothetical protein VKF42_06290 [Chitinivibrionales bacterium]|nr:hypothetical protein [Chitinivibrionales bacterium]